VTVAAPSTVYVLIDNRLSDTVGTTPPTFDATHMQWILDQGWAATANGLNRTKSAGVPDEIAFDEGANDTIEQYYSVYEKDFPAGTFSLFQGDNAGQNMYGVVVAPVPEPATWALGLVGVLAFAMARRRRA
jgi:MYXO-CTERM domain-containing protein